MQRAKLLPLAVAFELLLAATGSAQTAFTRRSANLRAGPSQVYPWIRSVPPGAPVNVIGCFSDLTWCDVAVGRERGWIYARNLEFPFQGRRVMIYGSGPMLGLPVVTFSLGTYWDSFYRGRPWFASRGYWMSRPPPPRRPPWGRPPARPPVRPPAVRPPSRPPSSRPPSRPPSSRPPSSRPPPTPRAEPK